MKISTKKKSKGKTSAKMFSTACQDYSPEMKEYVFAIKGRPFAMLSSQKLPVPPVSLIDFNLVRDLGLEMHDLQCTKYTFAGMKFRILGRVSQTLQTIHDGAIAGTAHVRANVVENLHQAFDTHSIAGQQMLTALQPSPARSELSPPPDVDPPPSDGWTELDDGRTELPPATDPTPEDLDVLREAFSAEMKGCDCRGIPGNYCSYCKVMGTRPSLEVMTRVNRVFGKFIGLPGLKVPGSSTVPGSGFQRKETTVPANDLIPEPSDVPTSSLDKSSYRFLRNFLAARLPMPQSSPGSQPQKMERHYGRITAVRKCATGRCRCVYPDSSPHQGSIQLDYMDMWRGRVSTTIWRDTEATPLSSKLRGLQVGEAVLCLESSDGITIAKSFDWGEEAILRDRGAVFPEVPAELNPQGYYG